MKKQHPSLLLIYLLTLAIGLLSSCKKDEDVVPEDVRVINHFIKENMDYAYFWNDQIPRSNPDQAFDSEKYFNSMLYDKVDHWSFITDDYEGLQNYFAGVRKSVGHSFQLYRLSDTDSQVIGLIEYVYPESPADMAGLKRGDLFYEINNQKLTIDNYSDLLSLDTYTITLGELNYDNTLSPISTTENMTAIEMQTNPILINKIIEHGGHKIGYLAYTSFIDTYDDELQEVFAFFKASGIESLVLDLRYNGGGAVSSAILMSSMMGPSRNGGEIFLKTSYNDILETYFKKEYPDDPEIFIDRFQYNANNLNLQKLVVLTTKNTASASEMVIYGLSPYMEVHQIGEVTHGKYYGSITISDPEKHNWAIQPIVMRAENVDNSIDYEAGLIPNEAVEDFSQSTSFYQLGDERELFLSKALVYLTGIEPNQSVLKSSKNFNFKAINMDQLKNPLTNMMYYNK